MNPLLPDSPERLSEDAERPKTLKVESIQPFGLFLEDGGFIHISKISNFHTGRPFAPNEIEKWYPVGSFVIVKLEMKNKLLNGQNQIFYDFLGPGGVIDIEGS